MPVRRTGEDRHVLEGAVHVQLGVVPDQARGGGELENGAVQHPETRRIPGSILIREELDGFHQEGCVRPQLDIVPVRGDAGEGCVNGEVRGAACPEAEVPGSEEHGARFGVDTAIRHGPGEAVQVERAPGIIEGKRRVAAAIPVQYVFLRIRYQVRSRGVVLRHPVDPFEPDGRRPRVAELVAPDVPEVRLARTLDQDLPGTVQVELVQPGAAPHVSAAAPGPERERQVIPQVQLGVPDTPPWMLRKLGAVVHPVFDDDILVDVQGRIPDEQIIERMAARIECDRGARDVDDTVLVMECSGLVQSEGL